MKSSFSVVYVTAPPGKTARSIALKLLKNRLAACVNVVPRVESHYWWKGKLESAGEALLIIKTRQSHVPRLINFVKKIHPYTVPEVIALPIIAGHKPYLQWLRKET